MAKKGNSSIENIREKIKNFPDAPGLYFMKDLSEKVLYIGKAKSLRSRVSSYFQPGADLFSSRGPKIAEMVTKVDSVEYLQTANEIDAILQEARLIKDIHPPYNTDMTDSKTFPYLEIVTSEDFPRVRITRKPLEKGTRLFGPFTSPSDLRPALVVLQKIFKFRTCKLDIDKNDEKRRFFRPCLLYSIKQCAAPCGARIDRPEYRKIIRDLIRFLNSKRSVVLRRLKKEMNTAAEDLDFEKAAMLRDRIRLIERLADRGDIVSHVQPEAFASDPAEALEKLTNIIGSNEPIRIIEGIDIAHIHGSEMVGSLVKFIDGRPFKPGYRRFRIRSVQGVDDYKAIEEVVRRRYRKAVEGEELWPDLILIDGGKGQLQTALRAIEQISERKPTIASIAKKNEEIYLPGKTEPLKLKPNHPARKLLQYVRDEAHRFAQHYHHILRRRKTLDE